MVPAYNGARMVVFGGCDINQVSKSTIFFLDVQTMQWSEGTPAASQNARCNMACTVRGDYFIAWGGNINGTEVADGKPLIYNIKDNKWVEQFLPTSSTTTGPNPANPVSPTSPPTSGPNGAAIGGGVAGGAVILGLLMFFFYRRHKQVNVKNGSESSETPLDAFSSAHTANSSTRPDIEYPPYPPNQPWSSLPPALRPRPIGQQQQPEYVGMESIIQAEPLASANYTNHPNSLSRNPQGQALSVGDTGIDGKEPFAYGDNDFNSKDDYRNSALLGPRNPQETKKSNDPQYRPQNPTEASYNFAGYPQRFNDPQGDGTNASIIRSGGGGVDGLDLRQQIAFIQAQNQDIERMRMEQQELLRKLQDQLDEQGKST
ncbi:hypothetical protein BGZ96_003214 [Linnemannia gamsii]|uniref:Galactose oxidase n=1 Tax=Linnemannia gamsii TaxID=64522 RepID=A0ABQ7K8V1_9FUNG|nr:hypothetical protein BGZ96_003214 [Linnemannia gamsii]